MVHFTILYITWLIRDHTLRFHSYYNNRLPCRLKFADKFKSRIYIFFNSDVCIIGLVDCVCTYRYNKRVVLSNSLFN